MTTETTNEELIPYQVFTDDLYFLNREQAEVADAMFANTHSLSAILFTVFIGLRGHKALDMSIEEYCEYRSVPRRTAYNWFEQVAVALNLACISGETLVEQVDRNAITLQIPSHRVAAELRPLSAETQRVVAERYEAILHHSLTSKGKVKFDQVQNIVKQFLPKPTAIYVPPVVPELPAAVPVDFVPHVAQKNNESNSPPPAVLPRYEPSRFVAPPESQEQANSAVEVETEDSDAIPEYEATWAIRDEQRGGYVISTIDAQGWDLNVFVPFERIEAARCEGETQVFGVKR